jgi:hypothetical protein
LAAYDAAYPTVEQALQAAKGLDVTQGNYFALAEELENVEDEVIFSILSEN